MTSRRRIMLVEDSENDVALTLEALREAGLDGDIQIVRDGQEALEYLFEHAREPSDDGALPDVMLLDLKLPRVNGLEVLAKVKSDPKLKQIPIVVLSASSEDSDLARSYDLGVNAYVVKPTSFNDFSAAIKRIGSFWAALNHPPIHHPPIHAWSAP